MRWLAVPIHRYKHTCFNPDLRWLVCLCVWPYEDLSPRKCNLINGVIVDLLRSVTSSRRFFDGSDSCWWSCYPGIHVQFRRHNMTESGALDLQEWPVRFSIRLYTQMCPHRVRNQRMEREPTMKTLVGSFYEDRTTSDKWRSPSQKVADTGSLHMRSRIHYNNGCFNRLSQTTPWSRVTDPAHHQCVRNRSQGTNSCNWLTILPQLNLSNIYFQQPQSDPNTPPPLPNTSIHTFLT